jgi:hypothetical protein
MNPTSPQMGAALRHMRAWAPARWVRETEDRTWRPQRFSTEYPTISWSTMDSLVRRGHVRVLDRTPRGACCLVELKT